MTQQPDSLDAVDTEVTQAEADSPYASAVDGAIDPAAGADPTAEPAPDVAEEYAESIPIDPTPDQVEHYLELVGDPDAESDGAESEADA